MAMMSACFSGGGWSVVVADRKGNLAPVQRPPERHLNFAEQDAANVRA
jgi:hypothetical protein